MLPRKARACLHLPNRVRKYSAACAGLLALFIFSPKVFLVRAQSSGKSGAKPAAKIDTSKLVIAPDLAAQVAKFKPVKMAYDSAHLTDRERQLVQKLVEACQALESIYWRQSDPEGLKLYNELAGSTAPRDQELRRFLRINGSRFNLIENNAPFVGTAPWPLGRALFPSDLTHEEFDRYIAAHPEQKAAMYDPWAVVRRKGNALEAIPYHVAYRAWLDPAVKALRDAAALSDDPAFAKFLRLRADSLLTDNYFESDLAWVSLENPKFDIIFAPYETYLDDFLGVKTSYGAAILIRNEAESRKLDVFQKYVPDIQDSLPLAPEDRPSKHGFLSPMEVMDTPYRAGDLRHGYQAVADNLPNDPRIHEQKGSKKIFFKNYMDARVNYVILPVAQRLLRPDQAALASAEGYLATTMMHEISHGLGPAFARTPAGRVDVRAAIGPTYAGLEEAKADIVGLYGLKWLVDHGDLPKEKLNGYYASEVAGIFRTVRFGVAEAHGRAEIMEFNFFSERGVVTRDTASGRYVIDLNGMPAAVAALGKELLEQEATGDRARVEAWFAKYGTVPPELAKALGAASDVPVDIDPISSIPEPMR
ncbi:MAG: Zn-dependent hydrolase [Acidobacteriia bacterium]|nr:Zn-dependent hydrolase [Terriglobia bacterium]